ncbi:serine/threonine protein phosphatase [Longilinea arvoryzae]|uniref:Serine/threonine protein phosphatase n=1 Tax=Longilinea arvoryzae TaxID=360412 RepID=A0A0S7B7E3_9CHLR|nr:protein phosphatase 2C domain-containing protein [Longilinea arvoryzae]GAP13263.1 serine/threonine protein phosphatase [Longilinea arvoryzae]
MIRVDQSHLPVSALTHPGMAGKKNEDRYAISAYHLGVENATPALVAVLSDGIGGHRAGEVAAEIAVNQISENLAASDGSLPLASLRESIQAASQGILTYSKKDPQLYGMGATCAVTWIIGRRLYTATVGDSRIYLVRGQNILQLSTDHTWVQEALESGILKPEQVHNHPNAHVIRRFLGSPTPPDVDMRMRLLGGETDTQAEANQGLPLMSGDTLLLCTDGLTDVVAAADIYSTLRTLPIERAVQTLIDLACSRNASDNITVIAIQIPENYEPQQLTEPRSAAQSSSTRPLATESGRPAEPRRANRALRRLRKWLLLVIGLVLVAALVIVLQIGSIFLGGRRLPTPTPRTPAPAVTLPFTQPVPGINATLQPSAVSPTTTAPTGASPTVAGPTQPTALTARPGAVTLTPWPTNTTQP